MLRATLVLLSILTGLAIPPASAQELAVAGERVNLRAGPAKDAEVVTVLTRGQALVEIERQDDWVHVTVAGDPPLQGWVHVSLVSAPGEVPAAASGAQAGHFSTFATAIDQLNAAAAAQGQVYFTGARDAGGGVAEVTASPTWLATPESFRQSNLDTLYSLWRAGNDPAVPVAVRILDDQGQTVMEHAGP